MRPFDLRPDIQVIINDNCFHLNDKATGFSVELEDKYKDILTESEDAYAFLDMLQSMGLTTHTSDLYDIRYRQRRAFNNNVPLPLERLQERLVDITRHVAFFRDRFSDYDPDNIATMSDIRRLPFMRKKDIRAFFHDDLLPDGINLSLGLKNGEYTLVSTSGSTEDRLQIVSRSKVDRLPFSSDDLLGIAIGGQSPKTAFFTTPLCSAAVCRMGNAAYEKRLSQDKNDLYLNTTPNPFSMQPNVVYSFCNDLEKFDPLILAANPIYLQCLIRRAEELHVSLPKIPLIQVGFEFAHLAAIRDIQGAFGCAVLNDYGASEENRLALQCRRGSLHVRSDAIHMEILNSQGECPPGVLGAIAITTFDTITPLVRYLIGDMAMWTGKKCDCEFSAWPCIELHGRAKDMIYSKNRWLSTLDIDRVIGAPLGLDFYRFIEHHHNHYELKIIPSLGEIPQCHDIIDKLSAYFNPSHIHLNMVSHFDPLPSMKIGLVQARASCMQEIPCVIH